MDFGGCNSAVQGGGRDPGKMQAVVGCEWEKNPKKLLMNVNVEKGLGPVHVLLSPENTVGDLIKAVVDVYVKEKRRPLLPFTDPNSFHLHYSQFSLQGLKAEEKLKNLGSRNFFLRPNQPKA
ncbi:hypothetical protein M9H77_32809 [Catharanthus roseus]|uniref:Uncharacterized protein n=1 Tax=Catharanthus roseus TaxID=4058 RepID=A0ACC0A6P8_CATRO|nr:hypothetical protein M9H77_32809 [Catharanthus roseus]